MVCLEVNNGSYDNISVEKIEASFYKEKDLLQVDALTADFANGGKLAAKGGIQNNSINLDFYASNVDMSLVKNYLPNINISGDANFSGQLLGNIDNPVLKIEFNGKRWFNNESTI